MTIRLLAQYQGNPPNTIVTLAGGTETALVAAGNASTDLSGGMPPTYITPANSQIGDVLYGPDGVPLGVADRTGKLLMNFSGITVPGAPTGLTLTPIAGGVLAAFTPSATLGGTVGTGFEVALSNGRVQRGAASPIVVNSPAGAVTATVKQINGAGLSVASAASASVTVTAYTVPAVPGAPTNLVLTAGNGKVTATWTAAAANGSAIRNTVVTLSNGATATAIGGATTVDVVTPNDLPVTATARANNGEGAGPTSAVSNSVTPASTGGAAPVFTAPPTLSAQPLANTPLVAVAGTFSGEATTNTLSIVKFTEDGAVDVGNNYTPTVRELQMQFAAYHFVSNSAGTDAATSPALECWQDPSYIPAFNRSTSNASQTGVTGEHVNPYLMAVEAPVGFRVRLWTGKRTTGATLGVVWEVETGVGTGVYATGAGTSNTTPYTYYIPESAAGRRMRAVITLGGTGASPQPPFTTDPIYIVPAAAATGKLRTISPYNRMPLMSQVSSFANNVARKVLSNLNRPIGSAPITTLNVVIPNLVTDGATAAAGPGNVVRIEGIDAVYNSVVVPLLVGGVAATPGAPLLVPDGGRLTFDEVAVTAFGGVTHIPAGERVLIRVKTDVPVSTVLGCVEGGDDIVSPAEHIWLTGSYTITNDIGNTNAGNNYLLSATGTTTSSPIGPNVILYGKFAAGDPKTLVSIGDSKRALPGVGSFHNGAASRIPMKAALAALNIARSGGNSAFFTGSAELVKYADAGWIYLNGLGINMVVDNPNSGAATGLISSSNAVWSALTANAQSGTGVHAPVVLQGSIDYHFRATNADTSTFSSTVSSRQTPYTVLDKDGDVQLYFVSAMQAAVQANTIAGYVEHRVAYSLNTTDPTNPLYYRVKNGFFGDQLHPGDARPGGRVDRKAIDTVV